jgi:hypothetical protein
MTELISRLFIGNWHEARDNHYKNALHVVTVAHDSPYIGDAHFKLVDGPGNSLEEFVAAVDYVCKVYNNMQRVLVHCVGGRSRSAAVIVAAAVKLTGRPFCEVYDDLLRKHDGPGWGARIHPYLSLLLLEVLK